MTEPRSLDLRGTPCPVNFIRCRLTLESMQRGDQLHVKLDRGEPEEMVILGLRKEGHDTELIDEDPQWILVQVTCGV